MGDAVSHTFRQMQNGTGLFYGWFEAMHSRFDLLTVGPTENEAAALCRDIAAEIRRIENRLNRFDEASDVWQTNARPIRSCSGFSPMRCVTAK